MAWTDRHYRYFARLISKQSVLYTEMVTTGALVYGDINAHLQFNKEEQPVALQLGGSNPKDLAECCRIAESFGYNEINLNVGCPSDRVQNNLIGACLMAYPDKVKTCLRAMNTATSLPITIKHRIGIDDFDSLDFLLAFVAKVRDSGCKTFIVHARKAILQGLSPKQNRDVPPLIYERVYRLKTEFPDLEIIINGGIKTHDDILSHLDFVDGVMIGREAYQKPWLLSKVDDLYYKSPPSNTKTRHDIVRSMYPYIEKELTKGQKLNYITRHMLGLFHGQSGGKQFRRFISENAFQPDADITILEEALKRVPE